MWLGNWFEGLVFFPGIARMFGRRPHIPRDLRLLPRVAAVLTPGPRPPLIQQAESCNEAGRTVSEVARSDGVISVR